jgi:hypothetical protein
MRERAGNLAWELLLMLARRERDAKRRIRRYRAHTDFPEQELLAYFYAEEGEAHNAFECAKRIWNEHTSG